AFRPPPRACPTGNRRKRSPAPRETPARRSTPAIRQPALEISSVRLRARKEYPSCRPPRPIRRDRQPPRRRPWQVQASEIDKCGANRLVDRRRGFLAEECPQPVIAHPHRDLPEITHLAEFAE